jgi:hypothetical protein
MQQNPIKNRSQKTWLAGTFSDVQGNPSFKRQAFLLLLISVLIGIMAKIDMLYIQQLSNLSITLGLSVASEQFSPKKHL